MTRRAAATIREQFDAARSTTAVQIERAGRQCPVVALANATLCGQHRTCNTGCRWESVGLSAAGRSTAPTSSGGRQQLPLAPCAAALRRGKTARLCDWNTWNCGSEQPQRVHLITRRKG